jgi:hypothetical protein
LWSLAFVLILRTLDTVGRFGRRRRISAALRAVAALCHFLVHLLCRCCSSAALSYHAVSIDAGRTAAQDCNPGILSNPPTCGAAAMVAQVMVLLLLRGALVLSTLTTTPTGRCCGRNLGVAYMSNYTVSNSVTHHLVY